jgi:hypothetical protein
MIRDDLNCDGHPLIRLESDELRVDVAPGIGGRIVSIFNKALQHEFLWKNERLSLTLCAPGSKYDQNFYGGIDEMLPSDLVEAIGEVDSPDHGELWTTPLTHTIEKHTLIMAGTLGICGLRYEKRMTLDVDAPRIQLDYGITNAADAERAFMWKMHAAVAIEAGDVIECPAKKGRAEYLEWSRWDSLEPFDWPMIQGQPAHIIPLIGSGADFFCLYDLERGEVTWHRPSLGASFKYTFDTSVFPCVWWFASYGQLDGHYVAVLEPCTSLRLSVADAMPARECSILAPGETLDTSLTLYAGPLME